jgi:hypothetical protein
MDDAVTGGCDSAEAGPGDLDEETLLFLDSTPVELAEIHWKEPVGDGRPVTGSRRGELALMRFGSGNVFVTTCSRRVGDMGREVMGGGETGEVTLSTVTGSGVWTVDVAEKGNAGESRAGNEDRVAVTICASDDSRRGRVKSCAN